MEFSAEFDSFSDDVVSVVAFDGAAKVADLLSEESVSRLDRINKHVIPLGRLMQAAPELCEVFDAVHNEKNIAAGMKIKMVRADIEQEETYKAHKDPIGLCRGLTLLLPTSGGRAFFGADEEPFKLFDTTQGSRAPRLFWDYGPGDGILLRQKITYINGERVPLGSCNQMWHVGVGARNRSIRTVDFSSRHLWLPGNDSNSNQSEERTRRRFLRAKRRQLVHGLRSSAL